MKHVSFTITAEIAISACSFPPVKLSKYPTFQTAVSSLSIKAGNDIFLDLNSNQDWTRINNKHNKQTTITLMYIRWAAIAALLTSAESGASSSRRLRRPHRPVVAVQDDESFHNTRSSSLLEDSLPVDAAKIDSAFWSRFLQQSMSIKPEASTPPAPTQLAPNPAQAPLDVGTTESAPTEEAPFQTPVETSPSTLRQVLSQQADLSTLVSVTTSAGATDSLLRDITLLAPNNNAFNTIETATRDKLLTAPWLLHLRAILDQHQIEGGQTLHSTFSNTQVINTRNPEEPLTVVIGEEGSVAVKGRVNTANVVRSDIMSDGDNSAFHVIDAVLLPVFMTQSIVDVATSAGSFSTLLSLVTAAGLEERLSNTDGLTVLAPTNDAFSKLPTETLTSLQADSGGLKSVLLQHVIPQVVPLYAWANGESLVTLDTVNSVTASRIEDSKLIINDQARVIRANILASNGLIHVLDAVLLPTSNVIEEGTAAPTVTAMSFIARNPELSVLAGVSSALPVLQNAKANLTLLAPVDTAFANVDEGFLTQLQQPSWMVHLRALLELHLVDDAVLAKNDIVPGQSYLTANGEQWTISGDAKDVLIRTDVSSARLVHEGEAIVDNGVVHSIDTVLVPKELTLNLLQVGENIKSFALFLTMLVEAGLDQTLQSETDAFTIFAPTDNAFGRLDQALVAELRKDLERLRPILQYHIVPGVHPAELLEDGSVLETLFPSKNLQATVTDDGIVFINNEPVQIADLYAKNGLMHAMSTVLLPIDELPAVPSASPVAASAPIASAVATVMPTVNSGSSLESSPVTHEVESASGVPSVKPNSIVSVLEEDGDFTTFLSALHASSLDGTLDDGRARFTLLAPTNTAFNSVSGALLSQLMQPEWIVHLREIILVHLIPGSLPGSSFTNGLKLQTYAPNNNLTVFAVQGGRTSFSSTVSTANVSEFNLVASNGIIHAIENVLMPTSVTLDVMDIMFREQFATLTALIIRSGLEPIVRNTARAFTILAPTDAAFAALPSSTVAQLDTDMDVLREVLLIHILPGLYPAELFTVGQQVPTSSIGTNVTVTFFESASLKIDNVPVEVIDIPAGNGLVHAIGSVLV